LTAGVERDGCSPPRKTGGKRGGRPAPPLFITKAIVTLLAASIATPVAALFAIPVTALIATPGAISAADLEAGRRKAEACAACHGPGGNSTNPTVPSLAGQMPIYLHWQLLLYRDKRRADPQMAPIAAALSEADMADLAAWFGAQRPATAAAPPAGGARIDEGRRLAETYHCNECHGRNFEGRDYAPRLRGLSREYLLAQMRGFKARTRGDLDGAMTQAAQPVADAEIEPIVEYIASLR
jgi:cytochrome c553